jgi:hypothetical protein
MKKDPAIAVVYLSWLPFGIAHFKVFIDSYINCPAGYSHKLIIAFNGTALQSPNTIEEYKEYLRQKNIIDVEFLSFASGQDISVYKRSAETIEADFFLFLNTYTKFEAPGWLSFYVKNWRDDVGLIGTTGSYADYRSAISTRIKYTLQDKIPLSVKFRELKYYIKLGLVYGHHFKGFPAPHVRTTGFFTSKEIFTAIKHEVLKDKMRAYFFENGRESMTAQVQRMGYECLLIDKNGNAYSVKDWPLSRLFWNAEQEDLLISDNQTRMYANASEKEKKILRKIAWNAA